MKKKKGFLLLSHGLYLKDKKILNEKSDKRSSEKKVCHTTSLCSLEPGCPFCDECPNWY
jgi:hypothetical protein